VVKQMENKEHVLVCVLGRTASGKDSLVQKLCERTGARQIISYTTRPRRENEGDTHVFVTDAIYEQMRAENQVAAFTQIGEYKYWSTIDQLYDNDLYIIDYQGIKTLRELNLPNLKIITIFINVPDHIREERALNYRKDNKATFRTRDFNERQQFRDMLKNADFDYAVSNIDFARAYSILRWICDIEKLWMNHREEGE
jgi:guanylate kinase